MLERFICRSISLLFLIFFSFPVFGKSLSPYNYGLQDAKNGEERYWALYNVHVAALRQNTTVDYSNIRQLDIEIPEDAKSIPLGEQTDFRGLVLNVENHKKDKCYLFTLIRRPKEIQIDKNSLNTYDFSSYPELSRGVKLLIVEDKTPWVDVRKGFNYGATRKEVLVLINGRSENRTIQPYNDGLSVPAFKYLEESSEKKSFKNLTFYRTGNSTKKTFLLKIQGVNNLEIQGVNLYTPENRYNWNADYVVNIIDCANVVINNVVIEGTYSLPDKFGYAFCLNNVSNVTVQRMKGKSEWGVFGCNNINKATILNSDLDRFDLHCYGRDYTFKNCIIRKALPLASMFGAVIFEKCTFEKATPCLYRADYNAYTPFDLYFNKCKFLMDKGHDFIVYFTVLTEDTNNRPELRKKCLPNISIRKCDIYLDRDVDKWDVIHIMRKLYTEPLGYISSIRIDGLKIHGTNAPMSLISRIKQDIRTEQPVEFNLKNIKYTDTSEMPEFHINMNDGAPNYNLIKMRRVKLNYKED